MTCRGLRFVVALDLSCNIVLCGCNIVLCGCNIVLCGCNIVLCGCNIVLCGCNMASNMLPCVKFRIMGRGIISGVVCRISQASFARECLLMRLSGASVTSMYWIISPCILLMLVVCCYGKSFI